MSIIAEYVNSVFKLFQTLSSSPLSSFLHHKDMEFTHLILGYLVLTAFNFMVDRDIVSPNNIDRERFYIILRRLKLPSFFYMRISFLFVWRDAQRIKWETSIPSLEKRAATRWLNSTCSFRRGACCFCLFLCFVLRSVDAWRGIYQFPFGLAHSYAYFACQTIPIAYLAQFHIKYQPVSFSSSTLWFSHRNTLFYSPFCSTWSEKRLRAPSWLTFVPIRFICSTRITGFICFKWFPSNNSARFDSSPKWWSILIGRSSPTAPKPRSSSDCSPLYTKTRCRKPPIFGM